MHFLRDKGLYRPYGWTIEQRRGILTKFTISISRLGIKVINVVIDKNSIHTDDYEVLEKALTYNIQRIDNDAAGMWKYLIISDQGRIAPMRKTARKIRVFLALWQHLNQETFSMRKPVHTNMAW